MPIEIMPEIYSVVDEDDKVVGTATRKEVHDKKLIHRSVMFFIFDKKRRILVTQRTKNKEFFKEYWSIGLGGHVNAGETYDEAVVREVKEEAKVDAKEEAKEEVKEEAKEEAKEEVKEEAKVEVEEETKEEETTEDTE